MDHLFVEIKGEPNSDSEVDSLASISISSSSLPPLEIKMEDCLSSSEHSGFEAVQEKTAPGQAKHPTVAMEAQASNKQVSNAEAEFSQESGNVNESGKNHPVEVLTGAVVAKTANSKTSVNHDTSCVKDLRVNDEGTDGTLPYKEHEDICVGTTSRISSPKGIQYDQNGVDAAYEQEWNCHVYRCVKCGMAFRHQDHLSRHMKVHTFACKTCGDEFFSYAELCEHENFHKEPVAGNRGKHTCLECQIDFDTDWELSRHSAKHIFACNFCSRTFISESGLQKHEEHHRLQDLRCDKCGREFQRKNNLTVHKQKYCPGRPSHTEEPNTSGKNDPGVETTRGSSPVQGSYENNCQNIFERFVAEHSSPGDHTDEDEVLVVAMGANGYYNCTKCPKAFSVKADYEKHLTSHSALGGVLRKGLLNAVRVKQESQQPVDGPTEQYKCKDCNVVYLSEVELQRHHDRHKYPCDGCEKTFTSQKQLWSHMRLHSREALFECGHCKKLYARQGDYERHVQKCRLKISEPEKVDDIGTTVESNKRNSDHLNTTLPLTPSSSSLGSCDTKSSQVVKKRKFASMGNKTSFAAPKTKDVDKEHLFCRKCNKTFSILHEFNEHMKQKHSKVNADEDSQPYVCSLCDCTFKSPNLFTEHAKKEHFAEYNSACMKSKEGKDSEPARDVKRVTEKDLSPQDRVYKCCGCKCIFSSLPDYAAHFKKHYPLIHVNALTQYHCTLCNRSFITKHALITHSSLAHPGEAIVVASDFSCRECEKSYSRQGDLTRHMNKYHPHEQQSSDGEARDSATKNLHVLCKDDSEVESDDSGSNSKQFMCKVCKKSFTTKGGCTRHRLYSHPQEHHSSSNDSDDESFSEQNLSCKNCQRTFSRQGDLTAHLRYHCKQKSTDQDSEDTGSSTEEFACKVCKKSFTTKGGRTRHILYSHPQTEQSSSDEPEDSSPAVENLSCKKCEKSFSRQGDLTKHIMYFCQAKDTESGKSGSSGEQLKCKKCDGLFPKKKDLTRHIRETHIQEGSSSSSESECEPSIQEPLSCKKCRKTFATEGNLSAHMRRYHPQEVKNISDDSDDLQSDTHDTDEDFSCKKCGRNYLSRGSLTRHIKNVHPGEQSTDESKQYSCRASKKTSPTKGDLTRHQRQGHQLEAARSDANFVDSSSENGMFSCLKCKKDFSGQRDLSKHYMQHHPQESDTDLTRHLVHHQQTKAPQRKTLTEYTRQHSKAHHMHSENMSRSSGSVEGDICEESFIGPWDRQNHFLKSHTEGVHVNEASGLVSTLTPETFPCRICKKVFPTRGKMQKHFYYYHPNERVEVPSSDGLYHCNKCVKAYSMYGSLIVHMKNTHPEIALNSGEQSQTSSTSKLVMDLNAESHVLGRSASPALKGSPMRSNIMSLPSSSRLADTDLSCNVCGKCFATKVDLRRHEDTHVFMCRKCHRFFTTKESLAEHEAIKHSTSAPQRRCDCGSCFQTDEQLKAHKQKHGCKGVAASAAATTTPARPKFICELCGEVFRSSDELDSHQEYHTLGEFGRGKREDWDETIVRQRTLTVRRKREFIEELFLCRFCDETFSSLELVHRHERTHVDVGQ